jgi:two-component system sensor histidine kinase RegB
MPLAPLAAEDTLGPLVRLRWMAIAAELLGVAVARWGLGLPVELPWAAAILGLAAASNLALALRGPSLPARTELVGPALLFDTLVLTALLHAGGDASNPFAIVYLVHVTVASMRTTPRWTWAITAGAVLGYGSLFLRVPAPDPHAMHGHAMHGHAMHGAGGAFLAHLQGMWLAFAVTAVLVAFFVSRLARSLEAERERAARAARLVSVSTLAAGAAHELSTPLGTIKVVAGELARTLEAAGPEAGRPEALADVRLIRDEVERMGEVLARLRQQSGTSEGEAPSVFALPALAEDVLRALPEAGDRLRLERGEGELVLPRRSVRTAITNLVKNALDAAVEGPIELALRIDGERLVVQVADRGPGIAAEVQGRLGEPFVTTKEPGRGMGLGLFLVQRLAEGLAGSLSVTSRRGGGALARLELPRRVGA